MLLRRGLEFLMKYNPEHQWIKLYNALKIDDRIWKPQDVPKMRASFFTYGACLVFCLFVFIVETLLLVIGFISRGPSKYRSYRLQRDLKKITRQHHGAVFAF